MADDHPMAAGTCEEHKVPKRSFPETLARRLRERAAMEWRAGNESNELHDLLREAAEWIEAYSEWSEATERLLRQVATPPSRK